MVSGLLSVHEFKITVKKSVFNVTVQLVRTVCYVVLLSHINLVLLP
jgi:hypothetical protein